MKNKSYAKKQLPLHSEQKNITVNVTRYHHSIIFSNSKRIHDVCMVWTSKALIDRRIDQLALICNNIAVMGHSSR